MTFPNKLSAFPAHFESENEADLMHIGGQLLADGSALEAMQAFDAALAGRSSLLPFLWQRGIALYYLRRLVLHDGVPFL
jgi:hypothetical protein